MTAKALLACCLLATPAMAQAPAQAPPAQPLPAQPLPAQPLPPLPAHGSKIDRLVGLAVAIRACKVPATPDQLSSLAAAGTALQRQQGITDAQVDAIAARFGNGIPATGCDQFRTDFDRLTKEALDTTG